MLEVKREMHLNSVSDTLLRGGSRVKNPTSSTVWSNTSNSNMDKLQRVQNFAGRIILGLRKYDHISDGLQSLKWLPIRDKLILNDANMMHKLTDLFRTILLICTNYVPKSMIDKLNRLVLWIYPCVTCQQGSALLLSEEPNSGTL